MKKFLSLVLAMIMTMSLVTISAGATEYKDLTDKDEIQYEEAVAVLNRIGVITGYDDGSFRPETELTRGAAAKIIVSLMIGPDAASALPNVSSPYPDVPASHTFAGVISYCKTAGYISGYSDGTFKPANPLTGYAFAKMLLGAIGYSSDIEGFTGSGWTMNVAKVGNVAGLFDRISFDGAAAVTRDQACQLALNTLKATMVTYGGTSIINGSTGSYTIQGTQANPVTSNNRDINANIGRKDWYGGNNQSSDYLTLEFGEEHFKDLRLEHDRFDPANDDFGRPSNEWSYKKVTIGTFPLEADYTFTTQVAHIEDTDGTKEKALGLRNYDLVADGGYSLWQGWGNTGTVAAYNGGRTTLWLNGVASDALAQNDSKIADIANYTDNGTLVEVYVSNLDADWITDVVVIQTQLMEVKKIGSDYVSLDQKDPDVRKDGSPNGTANVGFNFAAIDVKVEQVKDTNEDCYSILSGLKAGDEVAVIPVSTDGGTTYEAAEVYVPETVSGALTRVDTYGIGKDDDKDRGAVSITVGGTDYKLADWNDEMWELKAQDIKSTRKDVTLLMDKYGNALLAKDVGSTNDFMVVGGYYQSLVGNKVCTFVHGWDINGNELDLNLGSNVKMQNHDNAYSGYNHVLGELVYYTSATATGDADYVLLHDDGLGTPKKIVRDVFTNLLRTGDNNAVTDDEATYEIKSSNLLIPLVVASGNDYGSTNDKTDGSGKTLHKNTYKTTPFQQYYYDKDVKFIYVNYEAGDDEIESIEIKTGTQNVSQEELRQAIMFWGAQAAVKDDLVKAVVIKRESSDASVNRMLYVTKTLGFKEVDRDTNESFYEVEVAMFTADGKLETGKNIIVNRDLQIGDFATYTKTTTTNEKYADNYYRVKAFTRHNSNPAVLRATQVEQVLSVVDGKFVKHLLGLVETKTFDVGGTVLKPDANNDGVIESNVTDESFILGGYRGNSTTVPNSVSKADGVIRTDRAEWLDATRTGKYEQVESVEDLFELIPSGTVTLDILLNEKPDSDGFRTAYLIVIKSVGDAGEAVTGDVRVVPKDGGIATGGKIKTAGDGSASIEKAKLAAPSWVYLDTGTPTNTLAASGVKWNLMNGSTSWFSSDMVATVSATLDDDNRYTLTFNDEAGNPLDTSERESIARAVKEGYELVLTEVNWLRAKVTYTVNEAEGGVIASSDKYLAIAGGEINFTIDTDTDTTGQYTVKGIKESKVNQTIEHTDVTQKIGDNTSEKIHAVYGKTVEVVITTGTLDIVFALETTGDKAVSSGVTVKAAAAKNVNIANTETGQLTFTVAGGVDSANKTTHTPTTLKPTLDATLTVTLDRIDDTKVESYEVTVTINGKSVTRTLSRTKGSTTMEFNIPASYTVTKDDIKVTKVNLKDVQIEPGAVTKDANYDWLNVEITGVDVNKIDEIDVHATTGGSPTVASEVIVIDNNTIRIKFPTGTLVNSTIVTIEGTDAIVTMARRDVSFASSWTASDTVFVVIIQVVNEVPSVKSADPMDGAEAKALLDADAAAAAEKAANEEKVASAKTALDSLSVDAVESTATKEEIESAVDGKVQTAISSIEGVTATYSTTIQEPTADENGTATVVITLTAGEGDAAATDTKTVTVIINKPAAGTYAIATPEVSGVSDWTVTAGQSLGSKAAGAEVTFTLTAANTGVLAVDTAYTVTITGLTFVSAKITTAGTDSQEAVMTVTCKVPDGTNADISTVTITNVAKQ